MVIVEDPAFLQNLTELLVATDEQIITNYVIFRYTQTLHMQLGERYDVVEHVSAGSQRLSPRTLSATSRGSERRALAGRSAQRRLSKG